MFYIIKSQYVIIYVVTKKTYLFQTNFQGYIKRKHHFKFVNSCCWIFKTSLANFFILIYFMTILTT